jgi:hypothetical protein
MGKWACWGQGNDKKRSGFEEKVPLGSGGFGSGERSGFGGGRVGVGVLGRVRWVWRKGENGHERMEWYSWPVINGRREIMWDMD